MLTIVATPLGNLADISPRALEALKSADIVYCEDTRRTLALLTHYGLRVPLARYNERRSRDVERMLRELEGGRRLALVSDGGMPVISDPGWRVVRAARDRGLPVQVIPGPTAVTAAVAGSGLPGDRFLFLGFLPRAKGRQKKILIRAAALECTLVLYESPFRVRSVLAAAEEVLGTAVRAAVAREMTKVYEEWVTGTLAEVRSRLEKTEPRGEYVVVLHP